MKDFFVYAFIALLGILSYSIIYLPAYLFYKSKLDDKSTSHADIFFTTIPCIVYLLLCNYKDRQGFNYLYACGVTALVPAFFLLLVAFKASFNTRGHFVWALAGSSICAVLIWLFFPKQGLDRLI